MTNRRSKINQALHLQDISNVLLETDLVMDNTSSEPRDILMTERTALSWIKLSITLTAVAITVITNFRINTSDGGSNHGNFNNDKTAFPKFSYGISILFVLLSIATLCIGALTYFQSIFNYEIHHVRTFSLDTALGFLFVVGLLLFAINIVFMVAIPE